MMMALGVVWMVSEYVHPEEDFTHEKNIFIPLTVLFQN